MRHPFVVICLFLSFCVSSLQAQKFSTDPVQFATDVNTYLTNSKNQTAIEAGTAFSGTFTQFSGEQQKKIIEISIKLAKSKRLRAYPHFSDFFTILNLSKSKNISLSNMDSFLVCTNIAIEKYDGNQMGTYLKSIREFFDQELLFKSNYNSLLGKGGLNNFRFKIYSFPSKEDEDFIPVFVEQPVEQNPDSVVQNVEDVPVDPPADQPQDFFSDWDMPSDQQTGFGTVDDPNAGASENSMFVYPEQPKIIGIAIEFSSLDLQFSTKSDTSTLKSTKGTWMIVPGVFVGKGGTMDWSCTGTKEDISCTLREYNLKVMATRLYSEGAKIKHPKMVDGEIEGVFEYKENRNKTKLPASYPRFISFNSNIPVKGFGKDLKYIGGFSMSGKRIYSSSVDEGFGVIEVMEKGKPKLRAQSPRFELGDSLITALYSTMSLYIEEDSIYHPGVAFKYIRNKNILTLTKHKGFHAAPFIDTYHNVEIACDIITWKMDSATIDFNIINAKTQVPAIFESADFFNAYKFSSMIGMLRYHPLKVIVNYGKKLKKDVFYAAEVIDFSKLDPKSFKSAMWSLMKQAYIDYNAKTGLIKLKDKAKYSVAAHENKRDYDNISFISMSPYQINSTMNVNTHELKVRGVDVVYVSDSLKVNLVPDNKEIRILQNRNFIFTGHINTENFRFIGKDFNFNYDSFLVHMPQIDEIKLAVSQNRKKKANSQSTLPQDDAGKSRVLGNELKYSSGTLYINKPDNKSSRKKYPQYPIFDATSGASVFFDKKGINGGVYDTSVKFEIPPFRLDSLSSDDPHAVGFEGTFKSGGIFPEFKEKLIVMPDYSLGFEHPTPKTGYPLYGTTAKYYNKISLDSKGIRGDGIIKYLTTTLTSNDFIFYQDSVKTEGLKSETKEGIHSDAEKDVKFPLMNALNYRMKWLPSKDSMMISNIKERLNFYRDSSTMIGTAIITKRGLLGMGVFFTRGSVTETYKFNFSQKSYTAREAKFKILSDDPSKPALKGVDLKLSFDLDSNIARFSPEREGEASNSFPYVQYKSSLEDGLWDLKKKIVTMGIKDSTELPYSYFYSTRPDQDSLVYNASHGLYDIQKQELLISGIPFIKVADAKIYPDSNKVVVEQNAEMKMLKNCVLEIDTVKKYHYLYNGSINILSRNKFSGTAIYRYVNLGSDTLAIRFEDYRFEPGRKKKEGKHTVAYGNVTEEDRLSVGPKILYKGKVTMLAESPYLSFEGFVKLDLKGALSYSDWLKYSNDGESKEVKIDLQNATADNGTLLMTGLHLDKGRLYTTFISKKSSADNHDLFLADREFNYNIDSNEFMVGKLAKFDKKTRVGNNFIYNDKRSFIKYSGKFNFMQYVDEKKAPVKLKSTVNGWADLYANDYNFNALLAFQMELNSKITTEIGKDIVSLAAEIPVDTTIYSDSLIAANLEMFYDKIGTMGGDKAISDYQLKQATGVASINAVLKDLSKSLTFKKVELKWSPVFKAFYSVGKIDVADFLKVNINKSVDGFIEIRKSEKGDVINIYLEPVEDKWYFITYEDNRLAALTYSDKLNKTINSKSKGEQADRSKFFFTAADPMEKQKFVNSYMTNYLNLSQEEIEKKKQKSLQMQEEQTKVEDSLNVVQDSLQLQREQELKNENDQLQDKKLKKSNKKDKNKKEKEENFDQYQLQENKEEKENQEKKEEPKEQPTEQDHQDQKQNMQKMKDLFK